jgi:uncharacterized Zn-finger protein
MYVEFVKKTFKLKQHLTKHQATHENKKEFQCKLCNQAFNIKQQLERHVKEVHENERKYECPTCKKSFKRKQALKKHSKTHNK